MQVAIDWYQRVAQGPTQSQPLPKPEDPTAQHESGGNITNVSDIWPKDSKAPGQRLAASAHTRSSNTAEWSMIEAQ